MNKRKGLNALAFDKKILGRPVGSLTEPAPRRLFRESIEQWAILS